VREREREDYDHEVILGLPEELKVLSAHKLAYDLKGV
jgi:hypothetical protein